MFAREPCLAAALLLAGCQSGRVETGGALPSSIAILDGHSDFAVHYARADPPWSVSAFNIDRALPGQGDIPRWRAGGIYGMLATVGSDLGPGGLNHFPRVLVALDWLAALERQNPDDLALVRSIGELRRARAQGRVALIASIEGGDQIDGSLDNLRTAHSRGVRSMLIVYDHHNDLGDGAMVLEQSPSVAHAPHGGLSERGREVIAEMNRLGMMVDLSHASEETAHEAMAVSTAPVIFSHSAARGLADTPRNLSDETLRRLAANGGLVMTPLAPYLITTEHWRWWASGEAHYARLVAEHPDDAAAVERGMAVWDQQNPQPPVTVEHVADQIEYIARIAGHDHIGIGSDFDGMGPFAISGLEHAGALQALLLELESRGWSEAQLTALARGNFERVFARVEAAGI